MAATPPARLARKLQLLYPIQFKGGLPELSEGSVRRGLDIRALVGLGYYRVE